MKTLNIENFKGTASRSVEFGPGINTVTGKARAGKSTIAEAVPFVLFGVTVTGSPRCDHLVRQGTKKASVSAVIEAGGKTLSIERVKTKKGTQIFIDENEATQDRLSELLGITEQEFLAMYSTKYVLDMEPSKARAFFMSLLDAPEPESILKEMLPEQAEAIALLNLKNPDATLQGLREELKGAKKEYDRLTGALSEIKNQLEEAEKKLAAVTLPAEEEISALEEELARLKSAPARPDESGIKTLEAHIASKREEYVFLQKQKQGLQVPPRPGKKCPTCGQDIPPEKMALAIAKWEEQAAKVRETAAELDQKMAAVAAEGKTLLKKLEAEKNAFAEKMAEYEASRSKAEEAETVVRRLKELQSNKAAREASLQLKNSLEERRAVLEEEVKEHKKSIARLEAEIEALNEYRFKAVELQMKKLESHLKKVSVNLFEVAKTTGEIKPAFTITFDGRPLSMLSTSERTEAGLELALLVQELKGVKVPVYVDNVESAPGLVLPEDRQVIAVKVVPGQELKVEAVAAPAAA
ncbi:MAG: AAA family ATPase [Desulfotomaculales bacterium]